LIVLGNRDKTLNDLIEELSVTYSVPTDTHIDTPKINNFRRYEWFAATKLIIGFTRQFSCG